MSLMPPHHYFTAPLLQQTCEEVKVYDINIYEHQEPRKSSSSVIFQLPIAYVYTRGIDIHNLYTLLVVATSLLALASLFTRFHSA